jgi:ATP-dependent RNA helicase DDX18/HAS1
MATAKTGSGKSLAFLIPAVELLFRTNFSQNQGTGVIVLTPTRELAMQLYDVTKDLFQFNKKSHAVIYGGNYRKKEALKLQKGVNLLIATPGRLLDHLKNTENFNCKNLCLLIIDEADAILKIGFEEELKEILGILPVERQTMLFSATLTPKVENLVSLSMTDPVFVSLESSNESATVKNLEQGYILAKPDIKFSILYSYIKNNLDKKVIVFFASCSEVRVNFNFFVYIKCKVNILFL